MKAITLADPGDKTSLTLTDVPEPQLKPGEVLVEVKAAGVNRGDLLQAAGYYPPPEGTTDIMGLECAGVVVDAGDTKAPVGAEVVCLLAGGGYAEKVAVPWSNTAPIPKGLSFAEAAAVMEVACTVYSNLLLLARMRPGDTILIHGGAGGIGTFAIQMAKAMDCHVIVTCGTEQKAQACRELGADETINYREEDFSEVAENRADIILDIMGAKYLDGNVKALAPDGRIVTIGMQGGVRGELNIGGLLEKRGAIITSALRSRPVEDKAAIVKATVNHLWPLLADGTIHHVIDRILPLEQARLAHEALAAGEVTGKLVLAVGDMDEATKPGFSQAFSLTDQEPARGKRGRRR